MPNQLFIIHYTLKQISKHIDIHIPKLFFVFFPKNISIYNVWNIYFEVFYITVFQSNVWFLCSNFDYSSYLLYMFKFLLDSSKKCFFTKFQSNSSDFGVVFAILEFFFELWNFSLEFRNVSPKCIYFFVRKCFFLIWNIHPRPNGYFCQKQFYFYFIKIHNKLLISLI